MNQIKLTKLLKKKKKKSTFFLLDIIITIDLLHKIK